MTNKKYSKVILILLIIVGIFSIGWRYLCWEVTRNYDIEALNKAIQYLPEEERHCGRAALNFIFDGIYLDSIINITIFVVILLLVIYVLQERK